MWQRLRSLSRSRRSSSPVPTESASGRETRKSSAGLLPVRPVLTDNLSANSFSGEAVFDDAIGLTLVHDPVDSPAVDLIFVHGLGGASVRSWCYHHDQALFWPKYWLPNDLNENKVRILTFGYNAEVLSKTRTKANISDFAKSLLASMKYERSGSLKEVEIGKIPIVFVVHSMGGLVLKKAYLRGRNDHEHSDIVAQIRAILFLSTPHRGSQLADTLDMILSATLTKHTKKAYIAELAKNSSTIEELNEDFRHVANDIDIHSFYELRHTALKGNQSALIVAKDSSILGYAEEKSIPLDADHHNVCKFSNQDDPKYRSVMSVLKFVVARYINDDEQSQQAKVSETLRKIQQSLPVHRSPEADYYALRERRTLGTNQSLLEDQQFIAFNAKPPSPRILWMHGGPGCGKSVKSSFLIDHYNENFSKCQYYFFKHEDTMQRSIVSFFASMAFQLASSCTTYRDTLMRLISEGALEGRKDSGQLWKALFENVLPTVKFETPIVWILDALDECDAPERLISCLGTVPKDTPLHLLLTSRNLPSISSALDRLTTKVSIRTKGIDGDDKDIRLFIRNEVQHLKGSPKFHATVVEQLVSRAEGNFLWTHLALRELQDIHSEDELSQLLDTLPSGMKSMYSRMERSIIHLPKASDKALAQTILAWVTYAKRPLEVEELRLVLQRKYPSLLDLPTSVNQVCGGFVKIDSRDRVSLIHLTARDYLRHSTALAFSLEPQTSHGEIFDTSILALMDPRLRSRLGRRNIPPFCEYASTAWPYHFARLSIDDEGALSSMVKFLSGPFVLPWIEILAMIRQVSVIVSAATALSAFVQRRRKHDSERPPLLHRLTDLAYLEQWSADFIKVVGKFGHYLLHDSSIIYRYIPPLCPPGTPLYRQFGRSSLAQIAVSGISSLEWDDLLSRLPVGTAHQAYSLQCAGVLLAIATSANKIVVWNTTSFEEVRTLDQEEFIFQVCFNADGTKLASYGSLKTRIWDLPTGCEYLNIDNPKHEKPLTLQYTSEDTLIMCSDNQNFRELKCSNSTNGWQIVFPDMLKGESNDKAAYRNSPTSIRLNHDATQAAVAYRGAPLEVWDLESCRLVNKCKRFNTTDERRPQPWTGVNHVRWRQYEVLGLYTDGTVFKWDPFMEVHTEIPQAQDSSPSDIEIAPNGNIFLTSDVNGSMRIYNYHDFSLMYHLSSEDTANAMCFSPDNRRFYDIRGSYCNVWEPNALIRLSESADQANDVASDVRSMSSVSIAVSEAQADTTCLITCLAVNIGGSVVCYGDDEGTVTLCDIKNDSKKQIGSSPIGMGIERITWSDEGRHVAWEDLGRRLIVAIIDNSAEKSSSFAYDVKRVLECKIDLTGGMTKQILINSSATRLLALGVQDCQVWDLKSRKMIKSISVPQSIEYWANHPQETSKILAVDEHNLVEFDWETDDLQEIHRWSMKSPLSEESAGYDRQNILVVTPNSDLIIKHCVQSGARGRHTPDTQFIRASSLDPASDALASFGLPLNVAHLMERPLRVLNASLFVFIDKDLWVCTFLLEPQISQPLSGENEVRNAKSIDGESLERLGVIRHFFLPRDWVNTQSLALCTVLNDGTFLCPRKGEIAVIRSGLGSAW